MNTEQPPLCLRCCCDDHPDRLCRRDEDHDGDHDDGAGRQWMQHK